MCLSEYIHLNSVCESNMFLSTNQWHAVECASFNFTQWATTASCLDAAHSNRTVPGWQTALRSSPLSTWGVASRC